MDADAKRETLALLMAAYTKEIDAINASTDDPVAKRLQRSAVYRMLRRVRRGVTGETLLYPPHGGAQ